MHVEVGKDGRIVLPKEIREKKEIEEKTRIIVRLREGEILLIPVKKYHNPTQSLRGSLKVKTPIDDPKAISREHAAKKALERIKK
jgi:AbrB family looped-hinge helix DNA binding protein